MSKSIQIEGVKIYGSRCYKKAYSSLVPTVVWEKKKYICAEVIIIADP